MTSHLTAFQNNNNNIIRITKQIDDFVSSDKLEALQNLDTDLASLMKRLKQKESDLFDCEPELKDLQSKVGDQDGHKQNVRNNIALFDTIEKISKLEAKLDMIEKKRGDVEGVESAATELDKSMKLVQKYELEKQRRQGSLDTLKLQQRELKVFCFDLLVMQF